MSEAKALKALMPENLIWLAENVDRWCKPDDKDSIRRSGEGGWSYCNSEHCNVTHYSKEQWRAARTLLGRDDEPWPEERIDMVALNGATAEHYPEAGQKRDSAKPRMDLIPPLMEMEVARVLTFGAEKYSANNWRQVPDLQQRYIAAAKRHINAIQQGEEIDPESGLRHAAHAVCCLMFIGEIDMEYGH